MSDVVACTCGARIWLPQNLSGRALRSPRFTPVLFAARDERKIVATAFPANSRHIRSSSALLRGATSP
jgi:hypothetical protein